MNDPERDTPIAMAEPTAQRSLAVIGAGRVGRSVARTAAAAGLTARVAGREQAIEAAREAEIILLCVPDEAIAEVAENLAAAGARPVFAGHTSGASRLTALAALADVGTETFSLHPLQTVPDGATELVGAPAAIAGSSAAALTCAGDLADQLGMRAFEVAEEHRSEYHAAASIASNFLVALEQSAVELMAAAGIDDARELLAPLVTRTAANWARDGAAALTGPIARGDEATVAGHLEALRRSAPQLLDLYEALAERTRTIGAPDPGAGGQR